MKTFKQYLTEQIDDPYAILVFSPSTFNKQEIWVKYKSGCYYKKYEYDKNENLHKVEYMVAREIEMFYIIKPRPLFLSKQKYDELVFTDVL